MMSTTTPMPLVGLRAVMTRGAALVSGVFTYFGKSITSTPLVFWVYILGALYILNKLAYQHGMGRRKRTIRNRTLMLNSAEESLMESVVDLSRIDTDFSRVGGLEEVKQMLTEHVIWPFTHPEYFSADTVRSHPKGVLLYGPPGTGKTLLARALAKELGCSFISVNVESIFSKWVGETERNAAAVFTLAEKLSPCVIFVDEIDALLSSRNAIDASPHTNAKTIFMTHWDGLEQNAQSRIIVVGATNRPLIIDDAVRRRLPLQLNVPRPDLNARVKILNVLLARDLREHPQKDGLIQYVALHTPQYTGSDLAELCKAAALMPLREMQLRPNSPVVDTVPPLTQAHFDLAMKRIKATV